MTSNNFAVLLLTVAAVISTSAAKVDVPVHPTRLFEYRGMTFTNGRYCANVTIDSDRAFKSLEHLASTGANSVSIVVTQYQDLANSTFIYPLAEPTRCSSTPTGYCLTAADDALRTAIFRAHILGLKVMVKLQIDLVKATSSSIWRGDIGKNFTAEEWDGWFDSYRRVLLHYANIAQDAKAELFSVSCELIEASKQETHWRSLISELRSIYTGILTDSANWNTPGGHGEVSEKTWWDAVDIIGVDEYIIEYIYHSFVPGTGQYRTVEELVDLWQPIVQQLYKLHKKFDRPLMFTEVGYCSGYNGSCYQNGEKPAPGKPLTTKMDQLAQADQYEALFRAWLPHDWFLGVFWWNWSTDDAFGGEKNACMDPKFKPAEQVLRRYYNATKPAPPPPSYGPVCECWL